MTLDMAIGETSQIESTDKGKISEIVKKVRDLNARLGDIRREQVFQRVSECLQDSRGLLRVLVLTCHSSGARSGVQRPVRVNKCTSREVDTPAARRAGRDLCLAAFSFEGVLHQAKTYLISSSMHFRRPLISLAICLTFPVLLGRSTLKS